MDPQTENIRSRDIKNSLDRINMVQKLGEKKKVKQRGGRVKRNCRVRKVNRMCLI